MSALYQISTMVIQCPDITSAPCVKHLIDALFSSLTDSLLGHSKEGMVLMAHSPLSIIKAQIPVALLADASSFVHSFNVIPSIHYSYDVEQVPTIDIENKHILRHCAAE